MFPLYDTTPRRTIPVVNYLIIVANIVVFLLTFSADNPDVFMESYAFIPSQFAVLNPSSYLAMITSLFVHGGVLHILSNMWFLHIFGDNVEDRLGHFKYLLFYLFGGIAATLAQYLLGPSSSIPLIGASGAISAVAGAYFVYFRHSKVKSLVVLVILLTVVEVPVWLFLGYWFFIQLFSGVGSLSQMAVQDGGVAWFAHVGGFVFGYLYAKLSGKSADVETGEVVS